MVMIRYQWACFGDEGSGFRGNGSGLRSNGSGFRGNGLGFRGNGSGFRSNGLELVVRYHIILYGAVEPDSVFQRNEAEGEGVTKGWQITYSSWGGLKIKAYAGSY